MSGITFIHAPFLGSSRNVNHGLHGAAKSSVSSKSKYKTYVGNLVSMTFRVHGCRAVLLESCFAVARPDIRRMKGPEFMVSLTASRGSPEIRITDSFLVGEEDGNEMSAFKDSMGRAIISS